MPAAADSVASTSATCRACGVLASSARRRGVRAGPQAAVEAAELRSSCFLGLGREAAASACLAQVHWTHVCCLLECCIGSMLKSLGGVSRCFLDPVFAVETDFNVSKAQSFIPTRYEPEMTPQTTSFRDFSRCGTRGGRTQSLKM